MLANLSVAKADTLVNLVNWLAIPLLIVYLFCMVLVPWFKGNWDWVNLQAVWDRWQTLNAAILAFIASFIALNISKYHENKQRDRKFTAARAFLPHALSELLGYYKDCGKLLMSVQAHINSRGEYENLGAQFTEKLPTPPASCAETFSRCIEHADPDVGDYMATILMQLQVHQSRLKDMHEVINMNGLLVVMPSKAIPDLYRLAKLSALTEKLFPFARGMGGFDNSALAWNDYHNAYCHLEVWPEDVDGLKEFTERQIAKNGKTSF